VQTKPKGRNTGITLIEVVVALTIAALLTAAAVPALDRALDRARANDSTRELVAALKATRHEARASGADALFTLDVGTRVYRLARGGARVLAAPDGATLTLLTAESERLTQTAGAIRFFSDGSSTGGSVTLTYRGREQRVEIDWLTGHIRAMAP
jgi:general secretion pathway protein H